MSVAPQFESSGSTRKILFFGDDSEPLEASLKGYQPKGKYPFEVVSAAAIGVSHKYPRMCWPDSARTSELVYSAFVVDSRYLNVEDVVGALSGECPDVPLVVTQGTLYKEIQLRYPKAQGIDRVLNQVETMYRPGQCIDEAIAAKSAVKA